MTLAVIDRETQIDNLLALSNEDFQTLVKNNLGQETPTQLWQLLAHPKLARRTWTTLTTVYTDVCTQFAERSAAWDLYRSECRERQDGREAWFAGLNEYNSWRRRALGYKRLLNNRLGEIKEAMAAAPRPGRPQSTMSRDKKIRLMNTIFNLGWAIREHRERSLAAGIAPEQHDIALWDAIDEIEVQTVDGLITVAEMLDDAAAKPDFVPPSERREEEVNG